MDKRAVIYYVSAGIVACLAGIIASWQPMLVAGGLGLAGILFVLARLDWWQRAYSLTLLLMIGATSTIAPLVSASSYLRYAAAALLLGVTWLVTRKTRPVYWSKLHKHTIGALWFITALAASSIIWSVDRFQSAQQVVAMIILVGLVHLLSSRRWTDRALMVKDFAVTSSILTLAFLASLAAIALGLPGAKAYGGTLDTVGRFQGIFNNPNMLALLSAISIPLAWGLFKEGRRLLGATGVLSAGATLLLAESRTAIIAAAVAIVWIILRSGILTTLKFAYAALVGAVVLLATGLNPFASGLSRFGELEGGDVLNTRGDAWSSAVELVQKNPLGYGWQAGRQLFESLHGNADFTFTRTSVHNSYLQALLELGVLVILPLAYLVLATFFLIAVRGKMRGIEAGLVGVVAAGAIIQIAESAIFGTGQPYPYVFWFAIAAALTVYEPRAKATPAPKLSPAYKHIQRRHERESADA